MQLSLFDFLNEEEKNTIFNEEELIVQYAKKGSLVQGGKKRIKEFFLNNSQLKERVTFLKKEYGYAGFHSCLREPYKLVGADSSPNQCTIYYYNDELQECKININYNKLANVIWRLILSDNY